MKTYTVMGSMARGHSKLMKLNYNGTYYEEIATGNLSDLLSLAADLNKVEADK